MASSNALHSSAFVERNEIERDQRCKPVRSWRHRLLAALGAVFVALFGYLFAWWSLSLASFKLILPQNVGVWWGPEEKAIGYNVTTINGSTDLPPDLLGWWLVPVGLVVGSLLIWATTKVVLKLLSKASARQA